ncbi:MAG: T9SS type A sorting domain-containing protein [Bacteroidales bacterium]|nr:T9SS type A sorting domain-containing protein [Bacteroidales bacterium]
MKIFAKRSGRYIRVILVIAMAVCSSVTHAQHGWSFDSDDYEYEGEVNAVVVLEGVEVTTGSLGAFVGSECRGYSDELMYSASSGRYYFQVKVYSDEEGDDDDDDGDSDDSDDGDDDDSDDDDSDDDDSDDDDSDDDDSDDSDDGDDDDDSDDGDDDDSDDDDKDDDDKGSGEIMTFRYYDGVSFYDIVETVEFIENMKVGNPANQVIFNVVTNNCVEYVKSFNRGWNWFSINILRDDMSLNAIMPEGFTQGDNIKNQTQSATYYDNIGWFGSLEFFDPADFYKAYFHAETEITTCGDIIELENMAIELVAGWNYLGYLPEVSMPINDALSSLSPTELDYIKSQTLSATYYNGLGWWGNLTHLIPGEGYMIFLTNPGTVQYPDPAAKKAITQFFNAGPDHAGFNAAGYEYSGTLTAKVFLEGRPAGSPDDLLLAYVGDQLRGAARGLYFDPADAFAFQMLIHSNINEGEKIDFRYYHADSDQTYLCDESAVFSSDMIVADAYDPFSLNASGATGMSLEQVSSFVLKSYPNPFTDVLQVHTSLEEAKYLKLAVYNLLGKEIRVLAEGDFDAGVYHFELDSDELSTGIYIIRALFNDEQIIQKVTFTD